MTGETQEFLLQEQENFIIGPLIEFTYKSTDNLGHSKSLFFSDLNSKNEVKRGVLQRLLHGATEITKWGKSIMSGKVKGNNEYDASEV